MDASFQQLTEKNSRQQTTTSAVVLSAFGLEANICRSLLALTSLLEVQ